MFSLFLKFFVCTISAGVVIVSVSVFALGQNAASGSLRGTVVDVNGSVIVGATITLAATNDRRFDMASDDGGIFRFANLQPGRYSITAVAPGFARYEKKDVEIASGRTTTLDIALDVGSIIDTITVNDDPVVSTDPDANASATVLKGNDIKALPDDRAELEAALQALAGPGSGPGGGEIFIDGFSGGKIPPRDSIREVRINQNPFSSQFDRLGLGRIEIFTKPGTEEWEGEVGFEFEDESFNSRNPFAPNRPSFQHRIGTIDLSGPIIKKKASFAVDIELERLDNNALINSVVLDSALNAIPFRHAVVIPTKSFELSSRFDAQIGARHTAIARYSMFRNMVENSGIGGFDLPERAFVAESHDDTIQFTDVFVVTPTVINETRFQFITRGNSREGGENTPTIRVLDAFTAGGGNVGVAFTDERRFELQNYTSFIRGRHNYKAGVRLRHNRIDDSSPGNFAGTFTFTSLDQFRDTVLNLPDARPTQFVIAGGEPLVNVTRTDGGVFFQDDWRYSPRLTLSFGLRYEGQTNISSKMDIAPRFGFAFAPWIDAKSAPKLVFRGGFGVFYERFGESLTLQSFRFNGINQQQFVVTDPAILDSIIFTQNGVAGVPTIAQLAAFAQRQTTRVVSPTLASPYTLQTVFSVERQLPFKTTASATFVNARTKRLFRSRNINAPVAGIRPDQAAGNIFQYESTGRFNQNQLIVNFRSNFVEGASIFGNYSFGKSRSDSDGAASLPADSNDLGGEYGDSAIDVRHRFTAGANFETLWGVSLSPFITFRTGLPFNLTTGVDNNLDSTFNDRPSFAVNPNEPEIVFSRFGSFDPTPEPGDVIIPRNFGRGPKFFNVNLRIGKEYGFGGGDKEDENEKPYTVELSAQVRNLFNRTNRATPVGNLASDFFGQSVSITGGSGGGSQSVGNRRIQLEITFNF